MLREITLPDASTIAEEAFVLAYPLVLTSRTMTAAVNTLVHRRDTPDTLRSWGWLDLGAEPVVLTVPDTRGRYYVMCLRDAWNSVFASVGARTTGTAAGAYAVLGPGHHSASLPPGLTAIAAPSRAVRLAGCLEAVRERDDEAIERAHDGFHLVPLSQWGREPAPPEPSPAAAADAIAEVERMDAIAFFAEVARLVRDNPPDPAGRAALDRLYAVYGLGSPAPDIRASLERGVQRGRAAIRAEAERPSGEFVGRWHVRYGSTGYGADPLRRAAAARAGRSADPPADALHARLDSDSDGRPLSGRSRYALHFAPEATPPVHGFWSLTSTGRARRVAHATGDLRGLRLEGDGSLPIYLQHASPARERKSNWLPVPADRFSVGLDLYWPREEAIQRQWSPPPLLRTA